MRDNWNKKNYWGRFRISKKGVREAKQEVTVGELFENLDFGEFICPGGPLKSFIAYKTLKRIFAGNIDIKIEDATKKISS